MTTTMNKVGAAKEVNADNFVDHIELQFNGDPSRYKEFISIMKAYKKSRYVLPSLWMDALLIVFPPDLVTTTSYSGFASC